MERKYCISRRTFVGNCIGTIVRMAPANKPRKLEIINDKLIAYFRENTKQFAVNKEGQPYPETSEYINYPKMTEEQIKKLINNIVSIKEIEELNLSNYEYNKGVSVNDENRPTWCFVDRYSQQNEDDNFIDLWALTRNIFSAIYNEITED